MLNAKLNITYSTVGQHYFDRRAEPGSIGGGRSTGGGRTGGGRWENRGWEAGYLKGAGSGRNEKSFATLAQYFAIGKLRGGGSCYGRGQEPGVKGAGGGMYRPPCTPHWIYHPMSL